MSPLFLPVVIVVIAPFVARWSDIDPKEFGLIRVSHAEASQKAQQSDQINNEVVVGKKCRLLGEPRHLDHKLASLFLKDHLGREQYITGFTWPNGIGRELPLGARMVVEVNVVALRHPTTGRLYASEYKVLRWTEINEISGLAGEWEIPKICVPTGPLPKY